MGDLARSGGFWTDQESATQRLSLLGDEQLAGQLQQFIRQGFVIIPQAISPDLADAVRISMDAAGDFPGQYFGRLKRKHRYADAATVRDPAFRFVDLHVNSAAAREAVFAEPLTRLIRSVFEAPVLAFQSLAFISGSGQRMHQDTAYVVLSEPLKFLASWIALEDIQPGSGELMYYPGSQHFPDYRFGNGRKNWQQQQDGFEANEAYIDWLHGEASRRGIAEQRFLARKGDALIWAADLAHGGSPVLNAALTRYSLVTHYCPMSVKPNYMRLEEGHSTPMHSTSCFFGSRHYPLQGWQAGSCLQPRIPEGH